ncbi:MAG: hypothetical protein AAF696_13120 [Bacteroidota bacterium]
MNPGERGWLSRFVSFQKRSLKKGESEHWVKRLQSFTNVQEYLYALLQPTGFMYGYPTEFIGKVHRRARYWSEKDKIKILFVEGLLYVGLFFHQDKAPKLEEAFDDIIKDVRDFYLENYQLYSEKPVNPFGRRKKPIAQIEYLIDKRINIKYDWRNFWNSFFHNSLLFFDLIFFVQWLESRDDILRQTLKQRRLDLRLDILKVIAAAAHADAEIEREERELFYYFLHSAQLPAHKKVQAEAYLKNGIRIDELDFDQLDDWILRKYFLELAMLTTWANRDLNEEEHTFLRKLALYLDLSEEERESSMNFVQNFVMNYWERVHFLQIKQNYRIVSQQLLRQLRRVVKDNQRLLAKEVQGSRELAKLLAKNSRAELTKREKEKMRTHLLDALKVIPSFAYLFLPGSFLTLPLLLRVLPESVLYPGAARAELEEDTEE